MSQPADLQTQINALAARLAVLDGAGLPAGTQSYVAQTNSKLAGLRTDLNQAVLTLEGMINTATNLYNSLAASVANALGLSVPTPINPGTVVPPGS